MSPKSGFGPAWRSPLTASLITMRTSPPRHKHTPRRCRRVYRQLRNNRLSSIATGMVKQSNSMMEVMVVYWYARMIRKLA